MIRILSALSLLISYSVQAQDVLLFENDIQLHITVDEFQTENHQVDSCHFQEQPYICKIDGKEWFGSDMGMELPKYTLSRIHVFRHGDKFPLDVSQMFNPSFNGHVTDRQLDVQLKNDEIHIYAWFSDGAGTYCAKWIIKDGTSTRTLLSKSEADCF